MDPVFERVAVNLLVMLAMVPSPGESIREWWVNTGHAEAKRAQDKRDAGCPDAPFDPMITLALGQTKCRAVGMDAADCRRRLNQPACSVWRGGTDS